MATETDKNKAHFQRMYINEFCIHPTSGSEVAVAAAIVKGRKIMKGFSIVDPLYTV